MIVTAGCLIAMISFGPRSSIGFFLTPLSQTNHWGRDVFAFALAIQNLLWGVGQPFAGAIADRYGAPRVLSAGAVLYAIGLYMMASATTPSMLTLSAGVLVGFGLSGRNLALAFVFLAIAGAADVLNRAEAVTILAGAGCEGAHDELYGGWPMILSGLKTWLETGELLTTPGSLMYG